MKHDDLQDLIEAAYLKGWNDKGMSLLIGDVGAKPPNVRLDRVLSLVKKKNALKRIRKGK